VTDLPEGFPRLDKQTRQWTCKKDDQQPGHPMTSCTYVSLFSGVGGFDLGFDQAGWQCVAQVEWDKHCQQILARHWPDVARWGDIADVNGHDLPAADCVIFGSPCQDLSVAGKQAGLGGDRSSLFFEACRVIGEMREVSDGRCPTFAVWENVPGALSSNSGRDFGAVLDALAELGAVALEWRVLDAQWFGVPQRRRRVFVVACFDPRIGSGPQVLPIGASVRRDSAKGRSSRQEVAGTLGGGSGSRGWAADTDRMTFVPATFVKAGRAQTAESPESWREGGVAPTLNAFDVGDTRATVAVCDVSAAVTAKWAKGTGGPSGDECQNLVASFLQAPPAVVRRLTPRECERLMGWPDDHTRWQADGKEQADSHRYRQCGNGVATPVARWIATQLTKAMQ